MQALKQQLSNQYQALYERDFEGAVNAMDEFGEELGKGEINEINPTQLQARRELFEKADFMMKQFQAEGKPLSLKKAVSEAATVMFKDKLKTQAKRELVAAAKSRTKVQKPATTKTEEMEDPVSFLSRKLKGLGVEPKKESALHFPFLGK
jgi:hypothetical protein